MLRTPRELLFVLCLLALSFAPRAAFARHAAATPDPLTLEVPGGGNAYYYKPRSRAPMPIVLYLHGRGGNPFEDCRKWAKVATRYGWVVCPEGPSDVGGGSRAWNNDVESAKQIIDATVHALRSKFRSRVRTRGNILIGFSEGAFIAQQLGVRDADRWGRWLILAANDQYWVGDTAKLLTERKRKIKRIYFLTGENDMVAENTERAGDIVKAAHIPIKVRIEPGLGHEIPADRMAVHYARPLRWLASGR